MLPPIFGAPNLPSPPELLNLPSEWSESYDRVSRLTYRLEEEFGYGDLLCYAANQLDEQMVPCTITIEPASEPGGAGGFKGIVDEGVGAFIL